MNKTDPSGLQEGGFWAMNDTDRYLPRWQPPMPYRCGPSSSPFVEFLIPESMGGLLGSLGNLFNFNPGCTGHDICYGTCGEAKAKCDLQLYKDIMKECEKPGLERAFFRT